MPQNCRCTSNGDLRLSHSRAAKNAVGPKAAKTRPLLLRKQPAAPDPPFSRTQESRKAPTFPRGQQPPIRHSRAEPAPGSIGGGNPESHLSQASTPPHPSLPRRACPRLDRGRESRKPPIPSLHAPIRHSPAEPAPGSIGGGNPESHLSEASTPLDPRFPLQ